MSTHDSHLGIETGGSINCGHVLNVENRIKFEVYLNILFLDGVFVTMLSDGDINIYLLCCKGNHVHEEAEFKI